MAWADFSSVFHDVAGARQGGWEARLGRYHLGENVRCVDEELAARIADAPAPFWQHVRAAILAYRESERLANDAA